ncbi:MAG TPA: SDR family NAD(P)-dependent oxidoreductase [Gemmataceae bacterium]|jgi:NAD(P)-dependent dehydrogenase (short-subunit alcohol dehydrogenase family)|nr:SDR family NAD(P)-dependent oxidoreductase [Gemmataceae bacterium]
MSFPAPFDLTGRVALVTGGSKGLGLAMARGLARAGADIVISSRHESELKSALDKILAGTGRKGHHVVADMTRREDVARLAADAQRRMGKVDILINNAGSNTPQVTESITDTAWDTVIELNLNSVMALTRAVIPGMKERRWGRIVHISSIMAFHSKEGRSAYSATKAALVGMARAEALELGSFGVTVNCLAPGPFLTDLPRSVLSPAEQEIFAKRTAIGRWGNPDELAGPVFLLASDAGSYITGQTLIVDGGFMCR